MPRLALTIAGKTELLPEEEPHKSEAMRRYWEAHEAGDTTAALVRLDDGANGPMAPDDDDPPPAAPAAAAVAPGTVSELAQERIALHDQALVALGFALPPPLYAPGTRVLPVGDHNFRIERARVEALPHFEEAAEAVIAAIREEARRDLPVALADLEMTDYGTLMAGETELGLEPDAFHQLAVLSGFGQGSRYLAENCAAPLRATNVNAQLRGAPTRRLTLRTRTRGEPEVRQVYATVTPTYAAVDTDAVLSAAMRELPDARAELCYDGSGVRATALFMPDHIVDLSAGDIFKAGVRLSTNDTGRGRIRVSAVVFRNRCLNLLVIAEGSVATVSQVHRGARDKILATVHEGVESARDKIALFLDAWGVARRTRVDPEATLREWLAKRKLLAVSDKARDTVVESVLSAWREEPGDTLADCANALSRAAHEDPFLTLDFREEMERLAARLILVPR